MVKKWLALVLKIAVSGGLIWYLISKNDMDKVQSSLVGADPLLLLGAAAILAVQMVIGGLRWGAVLRAINVSLPFREAVRLFYIGVFFSQALPGGTGGDAVRIYMAYKADIGLRGAINGVILERVATVVALVLMALATLPFFVDRLGAEDQAWVVPSIMLIAGGAVFGLIVLCNLDRLPAAMRRWNLVRGLSNLAKDARAVFLQPRHAVRALFWSAAGHINISLCVYVLALSLALPISPIDAIILMPPVLLVMTVPISIGGWGVREYAMVVAFGMVGVTNEGATVLGFLLGLVGLAMALPGGLVWFLGRQRGSATLSDVEAELAAAGESETR